MRKRFAVVLLASTAVAAVFTLPAHASSKSTHRALRAGAHALRVPKSLLPHKADHVNVAWTPGAPLPVGVAETGGGAAAGTKFYVPGGYNSTGAVVNNLQIYNKTTNAWIQGAVLPGTGGGWADAAICYNSADNTLHVVNGVDGAFLYAAHQVYDVATNTWSFKSFPVLASGDTWYGQDQGCAFIGGKMYLFGGYGIISPSQPSAQLESATWVYDPATDTWTDTLKLMKPPGGFLWSGYTNTTTTAFVAGGYDLSFVPQKATQRFLPAVGWQVQALLPVALGGVGEANVQGHLIVFGGNDGVNAANKTYGCSTTANCTSWATLAFNLPVAKAFGAWGSGSAAYSAGGYDSAFAVLTSSEHLP